jgi:hypothetical protein
MDWKTGKSQGILLFNFGRHPVSVILLTGSFQNLITAEDVSVNVPHTAYRRLESGHGKTYLATSKQDMRDACTITVTDRTINFADQRVIHFSQEDGNQCLLSC